MADLLYKECLKFDVKSKNPPNYKGRNFRYNTHRTIVNLEIFGADYLKS